MTDYKDKYVLVRGDKSGVFMGRVQELEKTTIHLNDCYRIWAWSGAASLSELAIEGVANPKDCKIPKPTNNHMVLDVIEVIEVSSKALASIKAVKPWALH